MRDENKMISIVPKVLTFSALYQLVSNSASTVGKLAHQSETSKLKVCCFCCGYDRFD